MRVDRDANIARTRRIARRCASWHDALMGEDAQPDVLSRPDPGFAVNAVHMMRTTKIMTLQLSQMADQKANILMGATFVVFTLAVGQTTAG